MSFEVALGLAGFIVMLIAIDRFDRKEYTTAFLIAVLSVCLIELMPFFHVR